MDESSKRGSQTVNSYMQSYRLGVTVGIGAFSRVRLAVHRLTRQTVAIKIMDRRKFKGMEEKVRREIKILRLLVHPHIIRLYEVIESPTHFYVVMEYASSGELFDYIVEKGRLQEDEARKIFQQVISAIEYCHRNMVVHRDLKPENLLLDAKRNVKIADFGLSNIMWDGHFLRTSCGSSNYAAPEVLSGSLYAGPEVDVWSCGVILYALICGSLPFDDENLAHLYRKIKGGIYTLPMHLSPGALDLIQRILIVDPTKRVNIPEIRQHPWFKTHISRSLAAPFINTTCHATKIDEEVIQEVVNMGFHRSQLVESLRNRLQNEGTVAYYLLIDNQLSETNQYLEAEFQETMECGFSQVHQSEAAEPHISHHGPEYVGYRGTGSRSQLAAEKKWALGVQSQAHPGEIMNQVLKALQELNICWKKIGHYNMKCKWIPTIPEDMVSNPVSDDHLFGDESIATESDHVTKSRNVVKFEVQLYKTGDAKYVLDLQRVQGAPFFLLDLFAALLTQLRVF